MKKWHILSGEAPCGAIKGAVAPQRHTVDTPCTHGPLHQTEDMWPADAPAWLTSALKNHVGQSFVVWSYMMVPTACIWSPDKSPWWFGGCQTQSCKCVPFPERHITKWWVAGRTRTLQANLPCKVSHPLPPPPSSSFAKHQFSSRSSF